MKYFIDLSLLRRNPSFCLLYLGQSTSFLGAMLTYVALPFQVYSLTNSTLMVGLFSLFQLLPLLITALIGGVWADQYPRKRILLTSEGALVITCGLLIINTVYLNSNVSLIFLIGSIMSALNGIHRPALESINQQLVNEEDYSAMSSFKMLTNSIGMILGPAIGGIIIAKFGFAIAYLIDGMSFVISIICLLLIKSIPQIVHGRQQPLKEAIISGFQYAYSRQELIGTYAIDFLAMIFGMPMALFPAISENFGGAQVVGLFYSALAVGSLLISILSGWAKNIKRHGLAIAISASLWGLAIIGFGLAKNLWGALFFLSLAGAFDGISGIFRTIVWNETIPKNFRGRLAGIEMISYLSGPKLGDAEAGLVAAYIGVQGSVVAGGVLCLIAVVICCCFLPKFISYNSKIQ